MPSNLLREFRNWLRPAEHGDAPSVVPYDEEPIASASPYALVIEDEPGICKVISMTLAAMGVEAECYHTAREGIAALERRLPAIIFLDIALVEGDMGGHLNHHRHCRMKYDPVKCGAQGNAPLKCVGAPACEAQGAVVIIAARI